MVSKRRLCLTAEGIVVEAGDAAAATLLVGEGCELDEESARAYGAQVRQVEAAQVEDKSVASPTVEKKTAGGGRGGSPGKGH